MEKHMAIQQIQPLPQYDWPEKPDSEWQERMVVQYVPLIKYIASRIALRLPPHISLDDLISSGMVGLLDAIQKFDPRRNIDFKTYAEFRIKGAILDELRSLDWIPRSVRKKSSMVEKAYADLQKELGRPAEAEEVAASLGLTLEEFYHLLDETKTVSVIDIDSFWRSFPELSEDEIYEILQDESSRDPFITLYFSELRAEIVRAIESLPDKEKLLISLYYYEELTMKEIGEIMGYTESRISQKHSQAIARLRSNLNEYFQKL
ncbi:MAG: FliA/WhiG family RNA polymerase sigma factor [Deltaproteobacteria bacterium]|nr:FliA/WhiG family RNA polymerase sigma factor [Deltaproteobacteria bacterium]MBW1953127.1 FliA/WhiG family RNA polymerase sigma factor [Deltaproteobacteria bacterium]MBW1987005.1 FliA/WhiG family RNA polymerase sigma factor [Deltaproteobacteria bacterium]MBW2134038.1 FliA/WhiG family RNA polymerase sigma factor [Deltaproteobacteria bacterium]